MMSDSPPDRDLEWTERGVVASYKFINKIWDLVERTKLYKPNLNKTKKGVEEKFDRIVYEVSENIESFHFNKSVAKIYEYVNLLSSLMVERSIEEKQLSKIIHNLIIIINPFIPHISEEMWYKTGNKGLCASTIWPETKRIFNKGSIKMPVQINGKIRSLVDVENDEEKNSVIIKIMKDPKIKKYTQNKEVLKTIFVKNKIVNLVIK